MKFRTLAVAALLVTASSLFAADTFNVDKVHSEATQEGSFMGLGTCHRRVCSSDRMAAQPEA
mgnify:CR=1 FL=1